MAKKKTASEKKPTTTKTKKSSTVKTGKKTQKPKGKSYGSMAAGIGKETPRRKRAS